MAMGITDLLADHLARYPRMEAHDVYKLLFQAALGAEHAVADAAAARARLEGELASLGPGPDEPLLDPLSPDGRIVRIHLRPYLRAGRDPESLLRAFVRTANGWRGSIDALRRYSQAAELVWEGETIRDFFATMEAQGFPAAHHSEAYRTLYRPAYRVIARDFLE